MMNRSCNRLRASRWRSSRFVSLSGALLVLLLSGSALAQNQPPTDITLDSQSVDENQAVGTAVGNFSTTDADALDEHTYTLVNGPGGNDNASFDINGNVLETAAVFDAETKSSYNIRVQTDDGTDQFEKPFTITVNDVNDAPVLATIDNQSVNEGDTLNVTLTASDDDGDALTFSTSNLPSFCSLTDA
ncbi:MAG: cadherin domain-containing protein, partial [Woeseiaceae bacterium]